MKIFKTEVSKSGIRIQTLFFFPGSGFSLEKIMDPDLDLVNIRQYMKPWLGATSKKVVVLGGAHLKVGGGHFVVGTTQNYHFF